MPAFGREQTLSAVDDRPPLVCVVGPTGTGKSSAAIELARRFDGEIVSADSRQVYRGMDIGTAKVGHRERALVPHHLLDVCDPDDEYSIHRFATDARTAIAGIQTRDRLPIVVGGTGHYVSALTRGILPPGVAPDPALRAELERLRRERGVEALAERLREIDPTAAAEIDLDNPRRLVRAIEIKSATGRSIRELESVRPVDWRPLVLGLRMERARLIDRIANRTRGMFIGGLPDEIRRLLAGGYGRDSAVGRSIGYAEGLAYLLGNRSLEEAIAGTTVTTRQYARRQMTWFRNRESVKWFDVGDNLVDNLTRAVDEFLTIFV